MVAVPNINSLKRVSCTVLGWGGGGITTLDGNTEPYIHVNYTGLEETYQNLYLRFCLPQTFHKKLLLGNLGLSTLGTRKVKNS